ncbi:MAG: bifunctional hydroxymethylpyrimidine kinase/phosphomethylpyrimidine kinase [Gemmatimonadetes bacterium]|nr:bifunctional hydroxymethylpyrimidine kinase/phosphomethylpyrimidine kinase [Gemmatimonadota bacterium]
MIPIALTIAGSDSGGGAGIQADLKTFQAFGVFGTSVITALTAQNTLGVHGVHAVPAEFVRAQLDAVAADLYPAAFKTGMLATAALVAEVADGVRRHALRNFVLDPVMVASSGDRLLDTDAEAALAELLVPRATLVTPNLDEATLLTGIPANGEPSMRAMAEALVARGAKAALVKGGHLEGDVVADVLFDGRDFHVWRRPKLRTRHTHGTGCTLSAAVVAGLAAGAPLESAVAAALAFVERAIRTAPGLGAGHGPLNHHAAAAPAAPPAAIAPDAPA